MVFQRRMMAQTKGRVMETEALHENVFHFAMFRPAGAF
jgi:hypothetical protein